jgi:hypothetical protein
VASVDTRPRVRRSKESGNESYFKTSRAHFALGCFAALMTMLSLTFFAIPVDPERPGPAKFFPYMMLSIFAVITAMHLLVWWGAKQRRGWARITSLCIGLLSLTGFPIGTIIGVYLIYHSWSKWPEPEYYDNITLEGWPGQPSP